VERIVASIDAIHGFNGDGWEAMERFERIYEAILKGDQGTAVEVAQEVVDGGSDPQELIDRGMIPAMAEVGRRFEDEVYFVPELLLSARAMKGALAG
jgi:5-methyltetrahydrofolate--homocysteine methyltransferase